MNFDSSRALRDRIEELTGRPRITPVPVHEDSRTYMRIDSGSVLRMPETDYYVLGDAREGRFGIDDQPKFWVKYALDLTTGERKLLKLPFEEQFTIPLGVARVRCRRSADKESALLRMVSGHPRFMQGVTVLDRLGTPVRVVDFIRGQSLYDLLDGSGTDFPTYVAEELPAIVVDLVACIEAIAELHDRGQHHGDIRNDHLLFDRDRGLIRWIDFDYEVSLPDYDVWCMGNVITFVVGRGMHTFHDVQRNPQAYPDLRGTLDEGDALALYRHRIANLRKLFPYLPKGLGEIVSRFSLGTDHPYTDLASQARDLRQVFHIE